MRHLLILILLLSTLSFIGCKDESEATYLIDRAESLLKSDPDSSLILLDSIAVPDNLSDKLLARWCMLSGKVGGHVIYGSALRTAIAACASLLRVARNGAGASEDRFVLGAFVCGG